MQRISFATVRLPLGIAQWEVLRVGRRGFAGEAAFARRLVGMRLQTVPLPLPQLTTVILLATWREEAALESFRASELSRWQTAGKHLALTLRPVQSFGRWSGVDPLDGYSSESQSGPVLVVTHSRTRARSMPLFMQADRPVVASLRDAEGHLWRAGLPIGPAAWIPARCRSGATLQTRLASRIGLGDEAAVEAQRHGGWFSETWFARFAITAASGEWPGVDLHSLRSTPREHWAVTDFLVKRDDLRLRRASSSPKHLSWSPARRCSEVDTFGLTANNITYAVMGEAMSYWDFFPRAEDGLGPGADVGLRRGRAQ